MGKVNHSKVPAGTQVLMQDLRGWFLRTYGHMGVEKVDNLDVELAAKLRSGVEPEPNPTDWARFIVSAYVIYRPES